MLKFDFKKAVQTLNFFAIKEGGNIDKMKAIKLIWLSDRAHLRKYGRPIIGDTYYALEYGPIPSNTKDLAENNVFSSKLELNYSIKYIKPIEKNKIESISKVDEIIFSKTDIEILSDIYKEFGHKKPFELSNLSHYYPEWTKFEKQLKNKVSSRFTMSYLDFFENPLDSKEEDYFNQEIEHLELSKDYFLELSGHIM